MLCYVMSEFMLSGSKAQAKMTSTKVSMMMLVLLMASTQTGAQTNITAERIALMAEWFDESFATQSLEPDEEYFFQQVSLRIAISMTLM